MLDKANFFMSYDLKGFSRCRCNPMVKDILKEYPRLNELIQDKAALGNSEWDRLLKYIVANYDAGSPLIKEYPILPKRKEMAAVVAGYDLVKDKERLKEIYSCNDDAFTEVANNYLKEYGDSRLWAMIVSSLELFWEFNLRIFTPIKEDKDKDLVAAVNMKSKMSEELEKIHERIERLTKQFYGDDELQDATKKLRITPESIAGL